MRLQNSPVVLAGLAGLSISACTAKEITDAVVGVASLPRVCPSAVEVDTALQPYRLRFDPFVENRGVKDSTTAFTLDMVVTVNRGGTDVVVQSLPFISPYSPIIGTHAAAGVAAGPPVELTATSSLASRSFSYDPAETYRVTLNVHSNDSTFNIANKDCHTLGPISFKGGQPL